MEGIKRRRGLRVSAAYTASARRLGSLAGPPFLHLPLNIRKAVQPR